MLVENAGTVVTSAFFGTSISGTGTNVANVTVAGPNSIWNEAGILTVGGGGTGTLAVTGGGMVNAGQSQILIGSSGFGTNIASGTVTVDGVGSELAGGKLILAQATATAGSLTVSNGGLLSVNNLAEGAGGSISMAGGTLSAGTDVSPILGNIHGFGTLAATLGNAGVITASSGRLVVTGSIQSAGVSNIDGGATLEVGLGISANQAVNFVTPGNGDLPSELFLIPEVLQLDHLTATENFTLSNWRNGDELVVGDGSTVTGAQWLNGSALGGTLQVVTTGGTYDFTNVNLAVGAFPIFSIVGGNTVELVSCFAAGTRIATERGEVNVEDLREGDRVQLALDDQAEPIIWIGHRTVECWRHPKPTQVWPVRISADAFGPGRPCRDLWLSPDHAVYVEGVLIPVKHLINDTTIRQVPVDAVTYYHVELPQHAVLLAEGLPAESYLDVGDRTQFANGDGPIALYPDFASRRWEAEGCAPLVVTGPALEAARRLASAGGGDAERTTAVA
jgi:T5SS/PEP-CTERM-associated repeat protein